MSEDEHREAVLLIYRREIQKDGETRVEHDFYCPICDFWFIDARGALDHVLAKHKADWATFKIRKKRTLDSL